MYDIKKRVNTSGIHYALKGHIHLDFQVQIIEKVIPNTDPYRLEREEFWIRKFVTKAESTLWPEHFRLTTHLAFK